MPRVLPIVVPILVPPIVTRLIPAAVANVPMFIGARESVLMFIAPAPVLTLVPYLKLQ